MTQEQIENSIAVIKSMIERSRRETAESGHFFIAMGIFAMIMTIAVSFLEMSSRSELVIPAFIFMLAAGGFIGWFTVSRRSSSAGAVSYHRKLVYSIWSACSVPALMILFLFPLLGVYTWDLVPVFITLIFGIAVCASGIIFEVKALVWCSFAWWAGSAGLALIPAPHRLYVMLAAIFLGWVVPGWILNRRYRRGSQHDAA